MKSISDKLAQAYPKGRVVQVGNQVRLQIGNAVITLPPRQWQALLLTAAKVRQPRPR